MDENEWGDSKEEAVKLIRSDVTHIINDSIRNCEQEMYRNIRDSISDSFLHIYRDRDEVLNEIMNSVEGWTSNDDSVIIYTLRDLLINKLEVITDDEDQEDILYDIVEEFLERMKKIKDYPELKKIFIDIYNQFGE